MRIERGAAQVAQILANQARDRKLKPEPFTIYDFMLHDRDESVVTLEDAMRSWD